MQKVYQFLGYEFCRLLINRQQIFDPKTLKICCNTILIGDNAILTKYSIVIVPFPGCRMPPLKSICSVIVRPVVELPVLLLPFLFDSPSHS